MLAKISDPAVRAVSTSSQEHVSALAAELHARLSRALALAGPALGPDFSISGHIECGDCREDYRLAWQATREVIEIRLVPAQGGQSGGQLILHDTRPAGRRWLN